MLARSLTCTHARAHTNQHACEICTINEPTSKTVSCYTINIIIYLRFFSMYASSRHTKAYVSEENCFKTHYLNRYYFTLMMIARTKISGRVGSKTPENIPDAIVIAWKLFEAINVHRCPWSPMILTDVVCCLLVAYRQTILRAATLR